MFDTAFFLAAATARAGFFFISSWLIVVYRVLIRFWSYADTCALDLIPILAKANVAA
jgi:hypothetical protein